MITRKTCYALGVVSVALSMAGSFFVLFGEGIALLDNIGFSLAGMMFLFLAAVKDSTHLDKIRYFICFALLLMGGGFLVVFPIVNRIATAVCWPLYFSYEDQRKGGMRRQMILLAIIEAISFVMWLLIGFGNLQFLIPAANLVWVFTTFARAWGALTLYKRESALEAQQ